MSFVATGSQTVGPFFHIGLERLFRNDVAPPDSTAVRVTLRGRVIDGDGTGVPDAMVEIWQPETGGFGRQPTDADGSFAFTLVRPADIAGGDATRQAPHLNVTIFMRGLLRHLFTRLYFQDDPANAHDPVLQLVAPDRRHTLMARPAAASADSLEWNVVLQGQDETVFFEW